MGTEAGVGTHGLDHDHVLLRHALGKEARRQEVNEMVKNLFFGFAYSSFLKHNESHDWGEIGTSDWGNVAVNIHRRIDALKV